MSPKRQPRLIIIAAPSGAGKTTLCDMLLKQHPDVALSISTTTRPRRPNEEEGVHYHFVSDEEFRAKAERGEFAEWAMVHGNRYGTAKSTIERYFKDGKHILFDIDVQGALSLRQQYGEQTLLIFIQPPSMDALKARLVSRKGDTPEAIAMRLRNAKKEMERARIFDYQITNENLEVAFEELERILGKELG